MQLSILDIAIILDTLSTSLIVIDENSSIFTYSSEQRKNVMQKLATQADEHTLVLRD
jgi:hypothetical protein